MISIVIPIYNGERFLRPCLDSILSQSVREMEVICVNDGSKDGTQSILEEYAAKDPRVVVLQQENQGIAAARNSGMARATGEYLWFFDGDDVMQPGAAEAMLHRVQETGADLVMGNYQYYHQVSKEIQTPGQRVKTVVLRGNERIQAAHITPLSGCKLWRTAFLREHDVRFWALKLGEDTTFFLHGLALCETVAMLDKNIYYYRIYDGSTSYTYSLKELEFIKAFDQIDQWYAAQGDLEAFRRELFFDRCSTTSRSSTVCRATRASRSGKRFSRVISSPGTSWTFRRCRTAATLWTLSASSTGGPRSGHFMSRSRMRWRTAPAAGQSIC